MAEIASPAGLPGDPLVSRRAFVQAVGTVALTASVPRVGTLRAVAAPAGPGPAAPTETAVVRFFQTLTPEQRRHLCFPSDHPLRTPMLIQAGFALAFLVVALVFRDPIEDGPVIDLVAFDGAAFDLDGVITRTATVRAAAWKRLFDALLARRAARTGEAFRPFDIEGDYLRYVDGKPRYMFPRRDGIILGGTFDHDDWSLEPNAEQTTEIIEGHAEIMKRAKN